MISIFLFVCFNNDIKNKYEHILDNPLLTRCWYNVSKLTFEFVFNNTGIKGTTKVTAFNFYGSFSQTGICRLLRITAVYLINVGWISKWLSSPQRMDLPVAESGNFPSSNSFLLIGHWQWEVLSFISSSMFHGLEKAGAGMEMKKDLGD